jgi:hypothetical protein
MGANYEIRAARVGNVREIRDLRGDMQTPADEQSQRGTRMGEGIHQAPNNRHFVEDPIIPCPNLRLRIRLVNHTRRGHVRSLQWETYVNP